MTAHFIVCVSMFCTIRNAPPSCALLTEDTGMTFNLSLPQELPPTTRRTVQRALALLEHHLREPGASFTSTTVVRDWLCRK